MIFMNFFSRNSRGTGPKMRVPRGLFSLSMITIAFESNRKYEPSFRRIARRVRTTTASTTSPFFTVPSGAASLMCALMTSPTWAYIWFRPNTPIAAARRAPEESDALRGLARCRERHGPWIGQHRGIEVVEAAIGIDVGAREDRLEQRRAEPRREPIEPRNVRVLRLANDVPRRRMVEVVGIVLAGVRRVEHERQRRD